MNSKPRNAQRRRGRTYRKGNFARITVVVLGPRELPVAIRSRESDRMGPAMRVGNVKNVVRTLSGPPAAGARRAGGASQRPRRSNTEHLCVD